MACAQKRAKFGLEAEYQSFLYFVLGHLQLQLGASLVLSRQAESRIAAHIPERFSISIDR
jgi:hypothetical protein